MPKIELPRLRHESPASPLLGCLKLTHTVLQILIINNGLILSAPCRPLHALLHYCLPPLIWLYYYALVDTHLVSLLVDNRIRRLRALFGTVYALPELLPSAIGPLYLVSRVSQLVELVRKLLFLRSHSLLLLLLFLFDLLCLLVFRYQREEPVSEFLIVYQDPVLDGREVLENGFEPFVGELFWESELQDVVKLCAGHVPIAVSVNLFDAPHY